MYKPLLTKPEDTTIQIIDCYNRGGHLYQHAFIGRYAISNRLGKILAQEYGIYCHNGQTIPASFFSHYYLVEVFPDTDNENFEHFVTSDYWYTCQPIGVSLGIEF